ncbi:MAG: M1 family metallopeptidase [Candidatus Saccharimonadales bacterium]
MTKKVRRLYEQFQPHNYALELKSDAEELTFSGKVTITGKKVGRPSQRITFHQKDLKITRATLAKHDKQGVQTITVNRVNKQASYDEVRVHAAEMLYPGLYTITLEFTGKITEPMHGLYPCYFDHNGTKKKLLATQFESHHAREVFPSIDEPEAKATFDVTLETAKDVVVLGNTPVLNEVAGSASTKLTTFETSPIMSTYLLAFVIGEIHCAKSKTKDGTIMQTWATVAQPIESLRYANDEAVNVLEFFTDYFQTPFPLKKCDQVALPDFESGAMENWGLITYREIALLTEPQNRSQSSEQYVSMVIAHELSHQWFGNLVTMKWWDDLWLNESFASLMEHIALDTLHKDWHQWEQYTASDVISCSSRDIFKDVQPVHVDVNHPEEIGTLFDPAIVYAKGGRLLKMMREYIGDEAFRAGLKAYFAKHAYKNSVGDDLWLEMSAASGKDIGAFMSPWLSQSGMPLIDTTQTANTITLRQKRFVLDSDNDTRIWPVPLLASQPLTPDVLTEPEANLPRPAGDPVIINQNGSGHMLVHYTDTETRNYIAKAFKEQALLPESRVNIMNDQLLLARGGIASLTESLDIIAQASAEPRDAVWMIMARSISTAMGLTEGDESTEDNIKTFRRNISREWYAKLGWNDASADSPNEKALRQTILSLMVASEDKNAVTEAVRRYKAAQTVEDLPSEQRALIISAVVKKGEPVIDELIEQYKTTPNPDIQLSICGAITATKDPKVGDYIIEQALGENGFVRSQDIFRWYAYLMRNRHTRAAAWHWFTTSWNRLEKLFGDSKSFEYFVVYSAGPINTRDWQKEFAAFFTPKSEIIALKRNITIALSEIETRIAWRDREEPVIKKYFEPFKSEQ